MKRFGFHAIVAASVLSVVSFLGAEKSAQADILFDFEDQAATFISPPMGSRPGALTSLVLMKDGLTATITRPGSSFDIVDNAGFQGGKPASWGLRSLDPFVAETSSTPFIVDFSMPLLSFMVEMGDYGADSDTLTLEAYSGPGATGMLLDSDSMFYGGAGFPTFLKLTVADNPGFGSVKMIGGSPSFPNSVFYDNMQATVVPEPCTVALLGMGLAGLPAAYRRRKK